MTLADKDRYFNREWSWLHFNERVLEEAEDPANPLLERLKFISIFASNLDEFFMIRVAGLYRQLDAGIAASGTDRRSPREQIDRISGLTHALIERLETTLADIVEKLAEAGLQIVGMEALDEQGQAYARRYYEEVLYPVITPMIVGPKHPFPRLQNAQLYLVVRLQSGKKGGKKRSLAPAGSKRGRTVGFVALPRVLPRFVRIPGPEPPHQRLVPLESILVHHVQSLFSGYKVGQISAIRLTRDADIALDEEATEDMRRAMAKKLLGRRHGAAVRLEHGIELDEATIELLRRTLELEADQLYPQRALMQRRDLMNVYSSSERDDLKDPALPPMPVARDSGESDIFAWIRARPRLVHHPYESFEPVAELVSQAAADDGVLAIKQTLYRTSGDSPVIEALTRAAERGKQVTVVVELRARFDEERNIEWARRLEAAGAHVVYGLVGYKTHCKALLVVRRERAGVRRYVHLGTGNYNHATARLYTDLGLFSCDDLLGQDISALFNVITGATEPPAWNKIEISPTGMHARLLHLIRREISKSAPRSRGHIIAKMNALVDGEVIDALYEASQAGVQIDLIVRGICCLRPGVEKLSDNIRVRSIVGRFLEHARIFWFRNGGMSELYLASADWMPRNLRRRVELMFPVEDERHTARIYHCLQLELQDNVKARVLQPDGHYARIDGGEQRIASQDAIYAYYRASRQREPPRRKLVPLARAAE